MQAEADLAAKIAAEERLQAALQLAMEERASLAKAMEAKALEVTAQATAREKVSTCHHARAVWMFFDLCR